MSDVMSKTEILLSLKGINDKIDNYIYHNDSAIAGIKEDVAKTNDRVSCVEKIQQAEAVHKAEFEMEVTTKLDNILENQAIKESRARERVKTKEDEEKALAAAKLTALSSLGVGALSLLGVILMLIFK